MSPREWLDSVSEEDLQRWRAFDRVEPIGRSYEQTAMLCMQMDYLMSIVSAGHGGKYKPAKFKDWMPSDWIEPIGVDESKSFNWSAAESVVGAMFPRAK